MGRIVRKTATVTIDDDEDGLLGAVGDTAVVNVRDMSDVTLFVNREVDGTDGVAAELDLGTLATGNLDTVVQARTEGAIGNGVTVAASGDNDPLTKASLDLSVPGSATLDTVIEAHVGGAAGNAITFATVADGAGGGSITRVGTAFTYHYQDGVSTVGDLETAITALAGADDLIDVKTAGTALNTINAPADTFAATPLAGGLDDEGVTIQEVGTAVTIHYVDGESTVADVEAAITSDSTLISVKTAGTGATVLSAGTDDFAATNLAGGDDEGTIAILVESSADGTNYAELVVLDETDFPSGNGKAAEYSLSDANGMAKSAAQLRVSITTLGETSMFSVTAVGTLRE